MILRLRLLALLVAMAASTAIGIGISPARPAAGSLSTSARQALTPQAATELYYARLASRDFAGAYDLLCPKQQQLGEDSYLASARQSEGVQSWVSAHARANAQLGEVDGLLTLADGSKTGLAVLLIHESIGWEVCTSNLGGVLPGPAAGAGDPQGPSSITV